MRTSDWYRLYGQGWGNLIVPDAYAHPAKFSRKLIRHIYKHIIDEGWVSTGETILDPFGGVALGALHAMQNGLNWVGVELEPKFVRMGQENIDLWNGQFGSYMPNWGTGKILEGDSRYLLDVLGNQIAGSVASPPYTGSYTNRGGEWKYTDERRAEIEAVTGAKLGGGQLSTYEKRYGSSEGQLAALPKGNLNAAVASPPYIQSDNRKGGSDLLRDAKVQTGRDPDLPSAASYQDGNPYGSVEGQLGCLAEGVLSSPPYESSRVDQEYQRQAANTDIDLSMSESTKGYGNSDLGRERTQESIDTFWSAAQSIVKQVYTLLCPNAHAVWIVKSFVRKKEIVPFPDRWVQMCESVGFRTVHRHRAWLVEDSGVQKGMFGDDNPLRIERKSFFKRINEAKGSPRIDWEDVVCMVKV